MKLSNSCRSLVVSSLGHFKRQWFFKQASFNNRKTLKPLKILLHCWLKMFPCSIQEVHWNFFPCCHSAPYGLQNVTFCFPEFLQYYSTVTWYCFMSFVDNFLGVYPPEIYNDWLIHRLGQRCGAGWQELQSDRGKFSNQRGSKLRVMARCIFQEHLVLGQVGLHRGAKNSRSPFIKYCLVIHALLLNSKTPSVAEMMNFYCFKTLALSEWYISMGFNLKSPQALESNNKINLSFTGLWPCKVISSSEMYVLLGIFF